MIRHLRIPAVLLGLSLFALVAPAGGAVVSFPNFASSTGLTLNGIAAVNINNGVDPAPVLRLARNFSFNSGSAFSTTQINAAAFSTFFQFRITNPGGISDGFEVGADGFAFVIQNVANNVGGAGGGLGYQGIGQSVAVEFDTFSNGEGSSNHIGIDVNGSVASVQQMHIAPRFDDGNLWSAWIDYNGTTLEIRVNQSGIRPLAPTMSRVMNIPSFLGDSDAFIGFTAATGSAWGNHYIVNWEYRDEFSPINGVPEPASVVIGTGILLTFGAGGIARRFRRRTAG